MPPEPGAQAAIGGKVCVRVVYTRMIGTAQSQTRHHTHIGLCLGQEVREFACLLTGDAGARQQAVSSGTGSAVHC